MPLEMESGEQVLFPAPFVPTEHHALVITSARVVRYADKGAFPIEQFRLEKVDFIGRVSERSHLPHAIVAGLLGLLLFIAGAAKVLPPALHAGPKKAADGAASDGEKVIEGRNADDDYPFDDGGKSKKDELVAKAKKLQAMKDSFNPGIPPLTHDVGVGLGLLALGAVLGYLGFWLVKKERHLIFCRTTEPATVHSLVVKDVMEQQVVLSMLQAAQQSAKPKP